MFIDRYQTDFNKDETIAWNKLEENLSKMNAMKLRGYLVQGSNGEYCYLSAEERVEMIKRVSIPFSLIDASQI